ncbi:hypothetical protein PAHAL_3G160100 [Panicum hallii]|uniref:protein-serine/threonine phosphatase n=1 Tax=Panicum hallii TaxID=206008 RepID=A0A2T8KIB7_9POAL|nr:hypothetical protein PAHAL_3G160100 [Panicum hallii]
MVYDGAVKDQESAANTASASSAVTEASGDSPAASEAAAVSTRPSARPPHDKRLGVRHPLKHRRFRAGGKMMVEPGGVPPAQAVAEGEEEEETSEVEEDEAEEEEASSTETEMQAADVEVSSAPAAGVQAMEVDGGEMEASPEPAVAVGDTELEAQQEEEDEVSSIAVAQGERKQEATPATSTVLAVEAPKEKDQDKEREEKEKRDKERERQKERERADEVGYMSGGWKSVDGRLNCGYSSFRGKRASMEDFYDIKSSKIDYKQISLFGIFDGHGGSRAAEYLKEHLFDNLMKHPEFMKDTKLAIKRQIQSSWMLKGTLIEMTGQLHQQQCWLVIIFMWQMLETQELLYRRLAKLLRYLKITSRTEVMRGSELRVLVG